LAKKKKNKEIDLTATFTKQFMMLCQIYNQAFRKMIEEKLELTKNFIYMADLNKFMIELDLYDNTGT